MNKSSTKSEEVKKENQKGKAKMKNAADMDTLTQIVPTAIAPNPYNPRTLSRTNEGYQVLLQSVKAAGVLMPVIVAPADDAGKTNGLKYVLLAGSRRMEAAIEAGVETIPAIIKKGLTPEEQFQITFTENYAREDLTILEQGNAVVMLIERYQGDKDAAAAKLGKPMSYVATLAAIHNQLIKPWKTAIEKEEMFQNWTIRHLLLIARLPGPVQKAYLAEFKDALWMANKSSKDLAAQLAEDQRLLHRAPWKRNDATIYPRAGACATCSKRSHVRPELFEDDETTPADKNKNDRCLDVICWNQKGCEYCKQKAKELREENKDVVFASSYYRIERGEQVAIQKEFHAELVSIHFTRPAKKTEKGAMPALIVHGDNVGSVRWIKKQNATKTGRSRPKDSKGEPIPTPLKERRCRLDSKRWCQVLRDLREKLENTERPARPLEKENNEFKIAALVAIFGTKDKQDEAGEFYVNSNNRWVKVDDWKNLDRVMDGTRIVEVYKRLWSQVVKVLASRLTYPGGVTQLNKDYIAEARNVGKLIGEDVEAMFKTVSESKGFTEPKSWADLKADGTPKQVKSKKVEGKKKAAKKETVKQKCRICGCTEEKACEGGCYWVEPNLCSTCVKDNPKKITTKKPAAKKTGRKTKAKVKIKAKKKKR